MGKLMKKIILFSLFCLNIHAFSFEEGQVKHFDFFTLHEKVEITDEEQILLNESIIKLIGGAGGGGGPSERDTIQQLLENIDKGQLMKEYESISIDGIIY